MKYWLVSAGFAAVLMTAIGLAEFSHVRAVALANLTQQLYNHPLTVSNAVLEAEVDIVSIQRYVADIVLARKESDVSSAEQKIAALEKRVLSNLVTASDWFLGDKHAITETRDAIIAWRSLRRRVATLAREGRYDEAKAMAQGDVATQMSLLMERLGALKAFARNKASEFLHHANAERDAFVQWTHVTLTGMAGTTVLVAAFVLVLLRKFGQAIHASEAKYRRIVEDHAEFICKFLPDMTLSYVNEAYCQYFGKTRDELIGRNFFTLIPEADHDTVAENIAALNDESPESTYEHRVVRGDGQVRWQLWVDRALFDDKGKIVEYLSGGHDITEHKEALGALEASYQRYSELIQNMRTCIAVYRPTEDGEDFIFTEFNPAAEKAEHLSREAVMGRRITEVFPNVADFGLLEVLRTVNRTGEPRSLPISMYLDDRLEGWRENYLYKLASGEIVAVYDDLTALKKAEEALKISEARNRAIITGARDAIISIDRNGAITQFNAAASRLFGYDEDEALGRQIGDLVVPDEFRERHEAGFKAFLETGDGPLIGVPTEIEGRRKDGTLVPVELTISPISTPDGDVCTAIIRNITERRQAEVHLRQAQNMESVGNLAGGIAHDINNMLMPILNLTKMVARTLPEDSPERKKLNAVSQASERIRDLVSKILTFSRQTDVKKAKLKVHELVEEALGLLRATLPSTVTISEDIDLRTGLIFGDAAQLEAVLMNLAKNAADAMEGVVGKLEIAVHPVTLGLNKAARVGGVKPGRYAEIRLTDTGCGMDEATLSRIFDPFFTTKEIGRGTGLGVSMVHGIVLKHNGGMAYESQVGKGTTVRVFLPLVDDDEGDT